MKLAPKAWEMYKLFHSCPPFVIQRNHPEKYLLCCVWSCVVICLENIFYQSKGGTKNRYRSRKANEASMYTAGVVTGHYKNSGEVFISLFGLLCIHFSSLLMKAASFSFGVSTLYFPSLWGQVDYTFWILRIDPWLKFIYCYKISWALI